MLMAAQQRVALFPAVSEGHSSDDDGLGVAPCVVCYKMLPAHACAFCDKGACQACMHACDRCGNHFCGFCSIAKLGRPLPLVPVAGSSPLTGAVAATTTRWSAISASRATPTSSG